MGRTGSIATATMILELIEDESKRSYDVRRTGSLMIHELPEPHPGANEVRIRVRAIAVSPTDAGVREGTYDMSGSEPPYIPGMDAAGIIDETGDGSAWSVGEKVMAIAMPLTKHEGSYVEYLAAPDDSGSGRRHAARRHRAAVRDGGVFISVRGWKGISPRNIRFEAAWVFDDYHSQDKLELLRSAVEEGKLTPHVAVILPACEAP